MAVNWTPSLEANLLNTVLDEVKNTGGTGTSIKMQQWNAIVINFNTLSEKQLKAPLKKEQLQNKLGVLKQKYLLFKPMLKLTSGLGWDYKTKMPTTYTDILNTYLAAHPKAREFQFKPLNNFDLMDEIFKESAANGNYSVSSAEAGPATRSTSSLGDVTRESAAKNSEGTMSPTDSIVIAAEGLANLANSSSSSSSSATKRAIPTPTETLAGLQDQCVSDVCNAAKDRRPSKKHKKADIAEEIFEYLHSRAAANTVAAQSTADEDAAIALFENKFESSYTNEQRVGIKEYLVDNPKHAKLLLHLPEDQQENYFEKIATRIN